MGDCRLLNHIINAVFFAFFLNQCYRATSKYLSGLHGHSLSTVSILSLPPPSFTSCIRAEVPEGEDLGWWMRRIESKMAILSDEMTEHDQSLTPMIVPLYKYRGELHVLFCHTHDINDRFTEMENLINRQVFMSTTWPNELDVSNSWALIHDRNQLRRLGVPSAGSDQVYTKDAMKIMMYSVTDTRLAADDDSCQRELDEDLAYPKCFLDYWSEQIGCSIVSNSTLLTDCDYSDQEMLDRYATIVTETSGMSIERSNEVFGCRPLCHYQDYLLSSYDENSNPTELQSAHNADNNSTSGFRVQFVSSDHGEAGAQTEVLLYGWLNLVTDIGGFMGLMLGASILSTYDAIVDRISKKKR